MREWKERNVLDLRLRITHLLSPFLDSIPCVSFIGRRRSPGIFCPVLPQRAVFLLIVLSEVVTLWVSTSFLQTSHPWTFLLALPPGADNCSNTTLFCTCPLQPSHLFFSSLFSLPLSPILGQTPMDLRRWVSPEDLVPPHIHARLDQ